MSIWTIIQEELEKNGIDAYPPGTHEGECKKEYVVIKQSGGMQLNNYSSEQIMYDFMLYVPKNKYHTLDDFEVRVKSILDVQPLYPMLMPTGSSTPDYYDNEVKAHMRSFMYRINKRNKHL